MARITPAADEVWYGQIAPSQAVVSAGGSIPDPVRAPPTANVPPTIPGEHGTPGGPDIYGNTPQPPGPPYVVPEGTGGDTPKDPPKIPLNWKDYLTDWGFTQEIVDELDRIFRTYPDGASAGAAALGYIRRTDWYTQHFPGINEGIRKGLINDEQDYRAYTNSMNDLWQRYYGRDITGAETAQYLTAGHNVTWAGAHLQGEAYIKTNRDDLQYAYGAFGDTGIATEAQLGALGDQTGGLDNIVGQQMQRSLGIAQQRLAGVFKGTLASANFQQSSLGKLFAPSMLAGTNPSDVAAA